MKRMTSLELVASATHDTWRGRALPAELHPQEMRGTPSASTEVTPQQVVKERPPSPAVRSIDRGSASTRRPVEFRNEEGPDPFGIRASANRAWRMALRACLSRMNLVLRPIQPAMAARDERLLGDDDVRAIAQRGKAQGRAHERTTTLLGSVCVVDVAWFHGLCLGCKVVGTTGQGSNVERTVNSLYSEVNPLRECGSGSVAFHTQDVSNLTVVRRQNALALFQAYLENAVSNGASPKGLEQAFAATLQISPSMWSQIKSSRPIGDKLARQIEVLCGKPMGWLDEARTLAAPTPAESAFMELALRAFRSTNSDGRRALRDHLKAVIGQAN